MDKPLPSRGGNPESASEPMSAEAALRRSEERFRLLVESSPNAFVMVDRDGTITLVNRQGELLFGYRREELIGQLVEVLVPPDIREKHVALRNGFLAEPTQRPLGAGRDLFAIRKDGSPVPVEIGLTPIVTHEGFYVLATITDITKRRQAEAALRDSEERFRTLAEAVPQIVWTATGDGTIDYTNRRWYEYTGWSLQNAERWDWERVVHPDDLPEAHQTWLRVLAAGQPSQMEHRLRRGDGSYRWHLTRWWPLCDSAGRAVKWFGTATDIHDLKEAEENLRHLAHEFRRSNRDLEQFASMVSHDLQQPLVVTAGYLKLLKREQGEKLLPKSREYLKVALDSTQHMQDMVRGMLDYARVGRVDKPLEPTDLETVLHQVLLTLQEEIRLNQANFTHDPLPTVRGDRSLLEQVLQNLLGNALKFRAPGRRLTVHVNARREAEDWLISVQDNGIGMDPDRTGRIFDVFHQLHPESTYPGAGLGLAICKRIVEHHGGRIWADSRPDQGSTFFFTIPDRPIHRRDFIAPEETGNQNDTDSRVQTLISALEQTADSIFITDKNGAIEYVNQAFEQTTGYKRHEVQGSTPRILSSGTHDADFYKEMWTAITAGKVFRATFTDRRKSGENYLAEQSITPIRDADHNITHFVSVIKDVTEQRKMQEQETQMKLARAVQQQFYAVRPPHVAGFDIAGAAFPADATGGDYFDFVDLPEGGLGIAIGDVCGHGIGSALLMVELRACLRAFARKTADVGEILSLVNGALVADLELDRYATLALFRLHPLSRSMRYASAGHVPGYILTADGDARRTLESTDIPLGLWPGREFACSEEIALKPGETLALLTDGIIEAERPDHTQFGVQRALDCISTHQRESAQQMVAALYQAVRDFSDGAPQADDITAVICRVEALPASPLEPSGR